MAYVLPFYCLITKPKKVEYINILHIIIPKPHIGYLNLTKNRHVLEMFMI